MIEDPLRVAALAAQHEAENWRFRTYLKSYCRWPDSRLNRVAAELGRAAEAAMDCTGCGMCCRDNVVPVSDAEIERLSVRVRLPVIAFRTLHTRRIEDDPQALDANPCPFLEGTRCGVYSARPEACRGYPYIEGGVRSRMVAIIERAAVCPIVFEQIERLKEATGFRRLYPRAAADG